MNKWQSETLRGLEHVAVINDISCCSTERGTVWSFRHGGDKGNEKWKGPSL